MKRQFIKKPVMAAVKRQSSSINASEKDKNTANREQLTDELDHWYDKVSGMGKDAIADEIIYNNNASKDDSDPDEGFMVTMSDEDIANAIAQLKAVHDKANPQTLQGMIYALNSGTQDVTRDYAQGFLDACSWFADEYGIELDGLEE